MSAPLLAGLLLLAGCGATAAVVEEPADLAPAQVATTAGATGATSSPTPAPSSSPSPGPSPSSSPTAVPTTSASAAPETSATPAAADGTTALEGLAALVVALPSHAASYDRDAFGYRAYDTDHDGCDIRNEVLARDLADVVYSSGTCKVASGTLDPDPYSGETTAFTAAASTLDVDHVVSLGDAWISGAWAWDADTLHEFGNDAANMLAVSSSLNRSKSNASAASWLPPQTSFDCEYVAIQVAVKLDYGLTVTQSEHDAIADVLATCPDQALPDGAVVPAVGAEAGAEATASAPATTEPAAPDTAAAVPADPGDTKNCGDFSTWAQADDWYQTYAPYYGDVAGLDGDDDGVPCESLPGAP